MDKSMILELAGNATCYLEKIKPFDNKEYCKNNDEVNNILEKLCKDMPEDEKKKILWDLSVAQGEMECFIANEHFKEGFRLGLIIGAQNFLE